MAKRSVIADIAYQQKTGVLPSGADADAMRTVSKANVSKMSYNLIGSSGGWIRMSNKQLRAMADRYGVKWPHPPNHRLTKQEKSELIQTCYEIRGARKREQLYGGAKMKMASSIMEKFGGPWGVVRALENLHVHSGDPADKLYCRSFHTVRAWARPKSRKGMDGMIPHQLWLALMRAARYEGIILTAQDFIPELMEQVDMHETKQGKAANPERKYPDGDATRLNNPFS